MRHLPALGFLISDIEKQSLKYPSRNMKPTIQFESHWLTPNSLVVIRRLFKCTGELESSAQRMARQLRFVSCLLCASGASVAYEEPCKL